jgi:release factor glutamine methyltransferase
MNDLYRDIKAVLTEGGIIEGEAKAIALMLMEKVCGITTTEVLMNHPRGETYRTELLAMSQRIAQGEPVQYVLGEADFCGMSMKVQPGVLIPRKETEELVAWVVEEGRGKKEALHVLDIGTGSGCIAVTLAKTLEGAEVEAWDVSDVALQTAKENAERNSVTVETKKVDVLMDNRLRTTDYGVFDVIVSNPPYICEEEKSEMERNVLEHEPSLALFVPDNDPLLFYRRIGELGLSILRGEGLLFFEINRRFGKEVVKMLQDMGYQDVELRQDQFGNDRMVKAIKPQ